MVARGHYKRNNEKNFTRRVSKKSILSKKTQLGIDHRRRTGKSKPHIGAKRTKRIIKKFDRTARHINPKSGYKARRKSSLKRAKSTKTRGYF